MKLTEHDITAVSNGADAIVYCQCIESHKEIAGDLIGNHGAFEFRDQCALLALDLNEFIAAHFENYSEFKEHANRYFNRTGRDWLDQWDWDLCPAIIAEVLEIWKKDCDPCEDLYLIRDYHAQVLTKIFNAKIGSKR